MEVTLEKIELVKDRTGVSYKEAKDALEAADGSVVDAIINIEETIDVVEKKSVQESTGAILERIKELVQKGNVSKIVVKKNDGEMLLNLPLNAGIVGSLLAPWGVLAGILSTFLFKCVVEVVKEDGTIVDVSARTNDAVGKATEKGYELKDKAVEKGSEMVEKVKESELVDKVKNSEALDQVKNKVGEGWEKVKSNETVGNVMDKVGESYGMVKEKVTSEDFEFKDLKDSAINKFDDFRDSMGDRFGEAREKFGEMKETAGEKFGEVKEAAGNRFGGANNAVSEGEATTQETTTKQPE